MKITTTTIVKRLTKMLLIGTVSASVVLPFSVVSANEYYAYDESGNMTEKRIGSEVSRMEYNATNQLGEMVSSSQEVKFAYDRSGALATEQSGEVSVQYQRSHLSRIKKVVRGEETTRVFYDHRGFPVGKQTDAGITPWSWEGSKVRVVGSQVHNGELDLIDYLGSDLMTAKDATAFGENREGSFTGKFYDSDLGVFVFPYRFYRADLARWDAADPTGFPDGVNRYKYVSDPMTWVDPLGTEETWSGSTTYNENFTPAGSGIDADLANSAYNGAKQALMNALNNAPTNHWESLANLYNIPIAGNWKAQVESTAKAGMLTAITAAFSGSTAWTTHTFKAHGSSGATDIGDDLRDFNGSPNVTYQSGNFTIAGGAGVGVSKGFTVNLTGSMGISMSPTGPHWLNYSNPTSVPVTGSVDALFEPNYTITSAVKVNLSFVGQITASGTATAAYKSGMQTITLTE